MTTAERLKGVQEAFRLNQITGFKTTNKTRYRLFYSEGNKVCFYLNRSNLKGLVLQEEHVADFDSFLFADNEAILKTEYALINKYRLQAKENPYTNPWIEKCLALPDTFERWKKDGKKSIQTYGVVETTEKIGEVITVNVLRRLIPNALTEFLDKYANDQEYKGETVDFKTRVAYFSTHIYEDGSIIGQLTIICDQATTKVYNLINNDKFIIYSNTI